MAIRGRRYFPPHPETSHSFLTGIVPVGLIGDPRNTAMSAVNFMVDSGADQSQLGTEAVASLGLKRWNIRGIAQVGGFSSRPERVFLVPGFVLLLHQKTRLSRFTDAIQFGVAFAVPPGALKGPRIQGEEHEEPAEIDSLLGEDVREWLIPRGERSGKTGLYSWEYYEPRSAVSEIQPQDRHGLRIRTVLLPEFDRMVSHLWPRDTTSRSRRKASG